MRRAVVAVIDADWVASAVARKWPAGHRSAPAVFNSRWPARAP